MHGSILLVLLLIWGQDSARSLRLLELRVPAHVAAGGEALLGCQFDLEDDLLYSVKWYKDDREIYRYIPKNPSDQTSMAFKRPGVDIDLSRSSSDVVTLINLQPESAGMYRCEVSGEAPVFALASDEKYVTVHVLPKSGPRVTGMQYQYAIGDRVNANCTSPGSNPEAIVKWLVNKKPVHVAFLRGPWKRMVQDPPRTVETTVGLRFMVLPTHYRTGVMEITCQATIAPMYHREKTIILYPPEPDSNESNEASPQPQPLIPEEEGEDDAITGPDQEDYGQIQEDIIDKLREIKDKIVSEEPEIMPPTGIPENTTDFATLTKKSFSVMIVTLLIPVILL